ncbi:NAD(P)-binding domain-containing protein [Nocardioides sp. Y6]|uniref:NAD(P)-binding domain-containing protein n=1 Tax=Nocardioides malaquae TaxID=2773426 RepID=A0ABR9RRK3_9ACTN|nr:NAD(P)-binding domain-containing protein [Nocardioides malaquae]MBE7324168.1 NAD(P)-binding domain-containing protein [Nocardioides malaquae]
MAVIGAGPSGLAAAKCLTERGIPCVVHESHSELGGIWNRSNPRSSVYRNTHTITSREITAYSDFPMSSDLPVYPHNTEVLAYLEDYARANDLIGLIRFNSEVTAVEPVDGGWQVTTADGSSEWHSDVVIANGHNWSPSIPEVAGTFSGRILHSRDYDSAEEFTDQRVLVVGAGNSGCDIAVELAQVSKDVSISMRRGYHFFPKFLLGKPADQVGEASQSMPLPLWLVRLGYRAMLRLMVGPPSRYGLPEPDHKPLESPPIVNSLLPYYCSHGRITVRKNIVGFDGEKVLFADDTSAEFDAVVFATGFTIDIPFMDPADLDWTNGRPEFYLLAFSPTHDNLFISGMTDGTGGHFPTAEQQSQVIAAYIVAKHENPERIAAFDQVRRSGKTDITGGIRFLKTQRSLTQFELITFRRELSKHLDILEPDGLATLPAAAVAETVPGSAPDLEPVA